MNQRQREALAYHLDALEDRILDQAETPRRAEMLMHIGAVRTIVGDAHGAESHAGRRSRKRGEPAPPAAGGSAP